MARPVPFDAECHQQAVISLWEGVFGYPDPRNDPALAIAKKVAISDGLFFVAEDPGGAVVGTVMAGYDGHRGWIYSLAVDPGSRGEGIGSALMSHVEGRLRDLGCVKINLQILEGNSGVVDFYEKLGYTREPRISMGKSLPENFGG